MIVKLKNIAFLFLLFWVSEVHAQFGQVCVDSNRIQPYYGCSRPEFNPVCGCNLVTYRNDCVSFNNYGVNTVSSGVCVNDLFFFDFWPNIVNERLDFYLQASQKTSATLEIVDAFGKLQFYRNFSAIPDPYFNQTFYLSYLKPGVYYISVRSSKNRMVKKFVKT